MKLSKISAFFLPASWFAYLFFLDSEFSWIIRIFASFWVGLSIVFLWTYDDFYEKLKQMFAEKNDR
jgi:hypothetical protein